MGRVRPNNSCTVEIVYKESISTVHVFPQASSTSKAALAERANRSIQILIYKHLTANESLRFIDVLPQLVRTYNNRGHRTLNYMTPNEASQPQNEVRVRGIHMQRYASIRRKKPTLRLGAMVRVKTDSNAISPARRAYAEQFHGEYFTIMRINRRLPIPMYYLKSLDTGESIKDGFYANELSEVQGEVFKIEKVLKERMRAGKRELLVRWKWFNSMHDSWIPATDIVQVY